MGETSCPIVFGEVQLGVRRRKEEEEEEEGFADKERADKERREEERAGEEERSSTNSSSGKVNKISMPKPCKSASKVLTLNSFPKICSPLQLTQLQVLPQLLSQLPKTTQWRSLLATLWLVLLQR